MRNTSTGKSGSGFPGSGSPWLTYAERSFSLIEGTARRIGQTPALFYPERPVSNENAFTENMELFNPLVEMGPGD